MISITVLDNDDDDDDDEPTILPKKKPKMENKKDVLEIVDVDSFTPSGTSKSNPIPVDLYTKKIFIDLSREHPLFSGAGDDDDDICVLSLKPRNTPFGQRRRRQSNLIFLGHSVTETGQSSNSQSGPTEPEPEPFVCEICVEPKSQNESFGVKGCSHAYCTECMSRYVASKLQENVTRIECPVSGCSGALEPEHCRRILPEEVFDRWGSALCEAVILAAHKFYCPYKDCSAMLIDDGGEVIRESECPYCRRMFCVQCQVPWHAGIVCEEFQKLGIDERGREDIMLRELAKGKSWARCPTCNFYVEKVEGCMFVRCRCQTEFCYRCGTKVQTSHYCPKCKSS